MQPYVIKKHRQLSMPAKFIAATAITTIAVYMYRSHIFPIIKGRDQRNVKDFADDYFEKHNLPTNVKNS